VEDNPTVSLDSEKSEWTLVGAKSYIPTSDFSVLERRTQQLRKIRKRKRAEGNPRPAKTTVAREEYKRDPAVRADVLDRSEGLCELCRKAAPFHKENGEPFWEVHHIEFLAEGGADTVENAVALCPNCHREAHYGIDRKTIAKQLRENIRIHFKNINI
jgi:5-methylcytosine-specific restriction protein A